MKEEEIEKLAELARITVSKEERVAFAHDLDEILGYVSEIQAVSALNTKGVGQGETPAKEALNTRGVGQAGDLRNVMREDGEPTPSGTHTADILAEAPRKEGDYIKVKQVL